MVRLSNLKIKQLIYLLLKNVISSIKITHLVRDPTGIWSPIKIILKYSFLTHSLIPERALRKSILSLQYANMIPKNKFRK